MKLVCALLAFTAVVACSCSENANPDPTGAPYFAKVKNIIANNCLSCHASSGNWQGRPTKFDTDDDIVAAAPAIKRAVADPISPTNHRMPQGGSLSQTDIDIIVNWYSAGGLVTN